MMYCCRADSCTCTERVVVLLCCCLLLLMILVLADLKITKPVATTLVIAVAQGLYKVQILHTTC